MGYYLTIVDEDLRCKKDISVELGELLKKEKLYLIWCWGNGYVGLDEGYFKWTDEFLRDLTVLKDIGVRGYLTAHGEEGEYYKYEIDDEAVKEYYGSVLFSDKPEKIIKGQDDIKKYDF
jgi:hypothetical protein